MSGRPSASSGPADMVRRAGRTGDLLCELLTEQPAYRRLWRAHVVRAADSDPHQAAVARVMASHLWDVGEADEGQTDLPRQLKDVVARAISGRGVSHQSLEWFIRAFDMGLPHEHALWRTLEADLKDDATTSGPPRAVRVPPRPAVSAAEAGLRAAYVTHSLIETYTLGPDRERHEHHLVHVLEAVQELDRITYRFDTDDLTVSVPRGGAAQPLTANLAAGIYSLDIQLVAPLRAGQLTAVETLVVYPPTGRVVDSFERSLRASAGGVSLRVQFDPGAPPSSVSWRSRTSGAQELHTQPVELDGELAVNRFLTPSEDCVVGFEWRW